MKHSRSGGTGSRSPLFGAMFLMATSAIGPGFITQTTHFTAQLGAAFAFAIAVSVVVDLAVQLNVWRVIGVSGLRATQLGEEVQPGLGRLLATLVVIGGLVFNVGNVAGAGLGLQALLGISPAWGGALSALLAVAVFLSPRAGVAMDRVVIVLGFLMIALTGYVAFISRPPLLAALVNTVQPTAVDFVTITTLIGGTVGGYITYAGAHRLVDAGVTGVGQVSEISRASMTGVIVTGVMRALLFLAVLGVVSAGVTLDAANPAASAFQHAAGEFGRRAFGLVLWAAAITSVIGASYTSVSFLTGAATSDTRRRQGWVIVFIAVSTLAFLLAGQAPVTLLVFAGAFNGLILPIGLMLMLWVALRRSDLLGGYRYPRWLAAVGVFAVLTSLFLAWQAIGKVFALLI
jgi:Mn2+/Fe2+ NRAMP family transporter